MGRRKLELTPENIKQIEALAGYGLTEAAIAHAMGMAPGTFRRRKNGHGEVLRDEIKDALARGKAIASATVGKALFQRAQGGDVSAIRWWEMTRDNRSEKQRVELAGDLPKLSLTIERDGDG